MIELWEIKLRLYLFLFISRSYWNIVSSCDIIGMSGFKLLKLEFGWKKGDNMKLDKICIRNYK